MENPKTKKGDISLPKFFVDKLFIQLLEQA